MSINAYSWDKIIVFCSLLVLQFYGVHDLCRLPKNRTPMPMPERELEREREKEREFICHKN